VNEGKGGKGKKKGGLRPLKGPMGII